MCGSSRRRPITSPPGGGTLTRPETREQRACQQERGAHPAAELLVELVLRHVRGMNLNVVRPGPVHLGADVVQELEHRLDVDDPRNVVERDGLGR